MLLCISHRAKSGSFQRCDEEKPLKSNKLPITEASEAKTQPWLRRYATEKKQGGCSPQKAHSQWHGNDVRTASHPRTGRAYRRIKHTTVSVDLKSDHSYIPEQDPDISYTSAQMNQLLMVEMHS